MINNNNTVIDVELQNLKGPDPFVQEAFLRHLLNLNLSAVFQLLPNIDINFIYKNYEAGEYNAFQIICNEIVEKKEKEPNFFKDHKNDYILCAKIILESNIDLRYKDPYYYCQSIGHVIFTEEFELIELTIKKYEEQNISFRNIDLISSLLLYNLSDPDCDDQEFKKIIEFLLEKNIDINTLDYDTGEPPIYTAAKYKSKELIQLFCDHNEDKNIDFDYYLDSNGKSARNLILKYNLYGKDLPERNQCRFHLLFKHLKEKNTSEFIKNFKEEELTEDEKCGFLIRSVQLGAEEIVEYLLNDVVYDDYESLLRMACLKGFFKVVKILLEEKDIKYDIHLVRKIVKIEKLEKSKLSNHTDCLELILKEKCSQDLPIDLNVEDWKNKTVLQYAIERKHFKMILILLKYGASLVTKTSCLALEIDPTLLQSHFDSCITTYLDEDSIKIRRSKSKKRIKSVQCSYSIDYSSILPAKKEEPTKKKKLEPRKEPISDQMDGNENGGKNSKKKKSKMAEMILLDNLSNFEEYKKLLLHPLILVFISMKWFKVRYFFIFDIVLYWFFTLVLNLYIFIDDVFIFLGLFGCAVFLVFWELLQVTVFYRVYFTYLESWFKMVLIFLVVSVVVTHPVKSYVSDLTTQIYSMASLVSFINFFFIISHLPQLSTHVIMIKTVYKTLFRSFLTYFLLYVAFITSFYILFKDTYSAYFRNYGLAIFKTIIMSSGEYDTTNFDLEKYPLSYFLLILFVLLISIGLLNLLTGLAVSDIQNIKSNAELYSLEIRVRHISRIEKIFLKSDLMNRCSCFKFELFGGRDKYVDIESRKGIIEVGGEGGEVIPIDRKVLEVLKGRRKYFQEDDS